ncbi:MAG: hypothetical protein II855_02690 [Candidatus Methanomethylophilaceae archaeon]|nr:hypothetical protein [Candidatus Methanomethylophilaceae archaeon]
MGIDHKKYRGVYEDFLKEFIKLIDKMNDVNSLIYKASESNDKKRSKYYGAAYKKLKGIASEYNLQAFEGRISHFESSGFFELLDEPASEVELVDMKRSLIQGEVEPYGKLDKLLLKFTNIVKKLDEGCAELYAKYEKANRLLGPKGEYAVKTIEEEFQYYTHHTSYHPEYYFIKNYKKPPLFDDVRREMVEFMNRDYNKYERYAFHSSGYSYSSSSSSGTSSSESAIGSAIREARENRKKLREEEAARADIAKRVADELKK